MREAKEQRDGARRGDAGRSNGDARVQGIDQMTASDTERSSRSETVSVDGLPGGDDLSPQLTTPGTQTPNVSQLKTRGLVRRTRGALVALRSGNKLSIGASCMFLARLLQSYSSLAWLLVLLMTGVSLSASWVVGVLVPAFRSSNTPEAAFWAASSLLSVPVAVLGFSAVMSLAAGQLLDVWHGMEIIRTLAVARSVGLQVLLVVVKDLAPLAVATVAAWAGDRHWVAYGLATLLLAAMTLFVFYTAVAVHSTVSAMRLAHNDGLWTVLIRSARFQLHQLTACSGAVPACVWRGNADFETHPVQTRKGKLLAAASPQRRFTAATLHTLAAILGLLLLGGFITYLTALSASATAVLILVCVALGYIFALEKIHQLVFVRTGGKGNKPADTEPLPASSPLRPTYMNSLYNSLGPALRSPRSDGRNACDPLHELTFHDKPTSGAKSSPERALARVLVSARPASTSGIGQSDAGVSAVGGASTSRSGEERLMEAITLSTLAQDGVHDDTRDVLSLPRVALASFRTPITFAASPTPASRGRSASRAATATRSLTRWRSTTPTAALWGAASDDEPFTVQRAATEPMQDVHLAIASVSTAGDVSVPGGAPRVHAWSCEASLAGVAVPEEAVPAEAAPQAAASSPQDRPSAVTSEAGNALLTSVSAHTDFDLGEDMLRRLSAPSAEVTARRQQEPTATLGSSDSPREYSNWGSPLESASFSRYTSPRDAAARERSSLDGTELFTPRSLVSSDASPLAYEAIAMARHADAAACAPSYAAPTASFLAYQQAARDEPPRDAQRVSTPSNVRERADAGPQTVRFSRGRPLGEGVERPTAAEPTPTRASAQANKQHKVALQLWSAPQRRRLQPWVIWLAAAALLLALYLWPLVTFGALRQWRLFGAFAALGPVVAWRVLVRRGALVAALGETHVRNSIRRHPHLTRRHRLLAARCGAGADNFAVGWIALTAIAFLGLVLAALYVPDSFGSYDAAPRVTSLWTARNVIATLKPRLSSSQYAICNIAPLLRSVTALSAVDVAFLSAFAHEELATEAQGQALLDAWFGDGVARVVGGGGGGLDDVTYVAVAVSLPRSRKTTTVVSVRGADSPTGMLRALEPWVPVIAAQLGRLLLPLGAFWGDLAPFFVSALSTGGLERSASFRAFVAAVDALQTDPPGVGKLMLTGYSLGGGLATIAAARLSVPAITFSSPGARLSRRKFSVRESLLDEYSLAVQPERDAVALVDMQSVQRTMCELVDACGTQDRPVMLETCAGFGFEWATAALALRPELPQVYQSS